MDDVTPTDLRLLAVKIASSYSKANAVPVGNLTGLIQLAYQGLAQCVRPPAPPKAEAPLRKRRGRRPSVR